MKLCTVKQWPAVLPATLAFGKPAKCVAQRIPLQLGIDQNAKPSPIHNHAECAIGEIVQVVRTEMCVSIARKFKGFDQKFSAIGNLHNHAIDSRESLDKTFEKRPWVDNVLEHMKQNQRIYVARYIVKAANAVRTRVPVSCRHSGAEIESNQILKLGACTAQETADATAKIKRPSAPMIWQLNLDPFYAIDIPMGLPGVNCREVFGEVEIITVMIKTDMIKVHQLDQPAIVALPDGEVRAVPAGVCSGSDRAAT